MDVQSAIDNLFIPVGAFDFQLQKSNILSEVNERWLWQAVLEDAIFTVRKGEFFKSLGERLPLSGATHTHQDYLHAAAWIDSDEIEPDCAGRKTFREVCDILGLDYRATREAAFKLDGIPKEAFLERKDRKSLPRGVRSPQRNRQK